MRLHRYTRHSASFASLEKQPTTQQQQKIEEEKHFVTKNGTLLRRCTIE